MEKVRCIIVDDEPLALEILEAYVQKIDSMECVATFDSGLAAIDFLRDKDIDLVLLDIQMPDLSGIQVAELLNGKCEIIFTTAYQEYAVEGFALEAKDYLLKPISFDRFLKAVERIKKSAKPRFQANTDYIFVRADYKIKKVRLKEILYIEGMKDYLRIVTSNEKIMTLQSFSKLIPSLSKDQFLRVHKSYVISLDAIDALEKGKIKIGDQYIPVSDSYKAELDRLIADRMP